MAAFKQHITVSSLLGVGYAGALIQMGLEWPHAALSGALCAVSGMLPDLDSDSGKPVQEIFGAVAAMAPILIFQRMRDLGANPETAILIGGALYFLVRFGAAWIFKHLTVHRGMFHSIPAALIAAELVYLSHKCPEKDWQWAMPGGVLLGFLSHLVLDEIYAVDLSGLIPRLNKAAGSALKCFSKSIPATLTTWLVLAGLTYLSGVKLGYFDPIQITIHPAVAVRLER